VSIYLLFESVCILVLTFYYKIVKMLCRISFISKINLINTACGVDPLYLHLITCLIFGRGDLCWLSMPLITAKITVSCMTVFSILESQ